MSRNINQLSEISQINQNLDKFDSALVDGYKDIPREQKLSFDRKASKECLNSVLVPKSACHTSINKDDSLPKITESQQS